MLRSAARAARALSVSLSVSLSACFAGTLAAQVEDPFVAQYTKRSVMVPMRDGVRLYTELYEPRTDGPPTALVLVRTPYGTAAENDRYTRYFFSTFRELRRDGYVFAVQDARGRHRSEGAFEWNRPVRHHEDPDAVDASTDAYDTIDWLVANVPNTNGRVGMLGVSYPGWYVTMALVDAHPALKAASPQASPSDYFIGDDFFHFGAFRLLPSAELPYLFDFDASRNSRFPYDQVDTYEFFLDLGPLSNMNARYLKGVSPTWDHFMAHDTYDDYWKAGCALPHLVEVPTEVLHVVGWWDAENLGGALDIYDRMEPFDVDDGKGGRNRIVVGPWSHGQWAGFPRDHLGPYRFGSDLTAWYQQEVERPWFRAHLLGSGDTDLPEALMFQTGSNRWQRYGSWPPRQARREKLYLRAGRKLAFAGPTEDEGEAAVTWRSDPASPVPFSGRPIMGFWSGLGAGGGTPRSDDPRFGRSGKLWKVEDQRFVDGRPDVVTFVSDPLEADLEVAGRIVAHLHASTTGTDADWVVKLIDVYPESVPEQPEMGGYQLMVADDVLRAKFADDFEAPKALVPGEPREFVVDLRTRNHMFREGHRLMVQVQSTWFPLIDRNPQTYCSIPKATEADYRAQDHTLHLSAARPSWIDLDVVAGR